MQAVYVESLAFELRKRLQAWKEELDDYSHEYSPQKFTQPQLRTLVELWRRANDVAELRRLISVVRASPEFTVERERSCQSALERVPTCISELGAIGYRGLVSLLTKHPELKHALELKHVPNYSTLSRATKRLRLSE